MTHCVYIITVDSAEALFRKLAALQPERLAIMHGSNFEEDWSRALTDLAAALKDVFGHDWRPTGSWKPDRPVRIGRERSPPARASAFAQRASGHLPHSPRLDRARLAFVDAQDVLEDDPGLGADYEGGAESLDG